ncbi:gephyrin-like molybdotransferase Glp [Candidatus Hecatella orcuttiae]|uniref:molybdopterin molybdotransferase MoeA n=1 Tax=Candidatus Hecatella orcuttiae TaxID=1935119 RepID=UPI002867D30B|nr:gephyrin-like molybdotransferase Glp [Candidatus Hecatella orcuttiae]
MSPISENMRDVKLKGFAESLKAAEALDRYFTTVQIKVRDAEEVPISDAAGRVLAQNLTAEVDIPPFDRAAMDGYAVKAEDTSGASATNPVLLDVVGTVEVGRKAELIVKKGQAVRVWTGAPLPEGADAVIMLEYTNLHDSGILEVYRTVSQGQNVSKVGEDVRKGEVVLTKGLALKPQDLALLAALGKGKVKVVKKPVVAVASTGNELVEPGVPAESGKTFDSNRYFLLAAIAELGCTPLDLGIASEDLNSIKAKMEEGLRKADLTVLSGGTSVGARDLVVEALRSFPDSCIVVHGVAIRPGKPVALAAVGEKPVVLLPGYPVAAMVTFYLFVQGIIGKMLGTSLPEISGYTVEAKMARRVPSHPGVRDFVRVALRKTGEGYEAEPIRITGAGIISSMVKAQGLVVVPEEKEGIEKGETVKVTLLRSLEEPAYG